jgi:membrane-associated HD superfamily phosphohydrolase
MPKLNSLYAMTIDGKEAIESLSTRVVALETTARRRIEDELNTQREKLQAQFTAVTDALNREYQEHIRQAQEQVRQAIEYKEFAVVLERTRIALSVEILEVFSKEAVMDIIHDRSGAFADAVGR